MGCDKPATSFTPARTLRRGRRPGRWNGNPVCVGPRAATPPPGEVMWPNTLVRAPTGRVAYALPRCRTTSFPFRLPSRAGQGLPHTQSQSRSEEAKCHPLPVVFPLVFRGLLPAAQVAGGGSGGPGGGALGGGAIQLTAPIPFGGHRLRPQISISPMCVQRVPAPLAGCTQGPKNPVRTRW